MPITVLQKASYKIYFLQIRENQLVQTDKIQHDETWERRVVMNPAIKEETVKYYKFYRDVTGTVHNIKWYENKGTPFKGYKLELKDTDSDDIYSIDISWNNYKLIDKFLTFMPNVDFSKPLRVLVFPSLQKDKEGNVKKNQDGSDRYDPALVFYQKDENGNEVTVKKFYNYEENRIPENVTPKQVGKTKKWNFDLYYEFLTDNFDKLVIQKHFPTNQQTPIVEAEVNDLVDSEIPF